VIPVSSVRVGPTAESLVLEVLRSGQLTQGPMVQRLEDQFAAVCGCKHAVAVNNGTSALVAALEILGVGPGAEVITSPFTFVATANAILRVGATVRFADIGSDFNIDPAAAAALVNDRTAAVMPVHLYGQMADVATLLQLLPRQDVAIVEDAAQAHGALLDGRAAGSFGIGCFSLYATKNVAAGEGGLITTNDDHIAERLRVMRNQGMRRRYAYEVVGDNLRLSDVHAAIAIPQVERLSELTEARRRNADRLIEGLRGTPGLTLPQEIGGRRHVWHQFTVRVTHAAHLDRDGLAAALADRGVGTGIYYPNALVDYPIYTEHPRVSCDDVPNARQAAHEVLSLPVHPDLADEDVDRIIDAVRGALHA
jgi:perosamine synthetase